MNASELSEELATKVAKPSKALKTPKTQPRTTVVLVLQKSESAGLRLFWMRHSPALAG